MFRLLAVMEATAATLTVERTTELRFQMGALAAREETFTSVQALG